MLHPDKALEIIRNIEHEPVLEKIDIILGPADPPSRPGTCLLCVGDCSTKTARASGLPQIRGCHPDYREIINFFFPGTYDIEEN